MDGHLSKIIKGDTHMDVIIGVSNMNFQNMKTASNKPMSTPIC